MTSAAKPRGKDKIAPALSDDALSSLLQTLPLACIVIDQAREIIGWNRGAEILLGWSASEALRRPISFLLPDDATRRLVEPSGPVRGDVSLKKKHGETISVEIWNAPLPATSSIQAGRLLLLQDISEKKFLEKALLDASEREQRRIGQELHDHLCQHLVGAAFATKAIAGTLDREASPHAPQLHDLARLINDAVFQVRDISHSLHPVERDAAGLMSALQELATRSSRLIPCTFQCPRQILVKNPETAANAHRIAQEIVALLLSQTEAQKIEITLSQTGPSLSLQISANGKKESELTANPAGVAIRTLHYRAQAMHGSLSLKFEPDKGTLVTCLFPS